VTTAQTHEQDVVSKATLKHHRCSAQKVRLVVDQIRGKNVNRALSLLYLSPKSVSRPIEKLLRSAVANAEKAEERVDVDVLYVGEVYVGQGPTFKRSRGRAFGRAFRIRHRSCFLVFEPTNSIWSLRGFPPGGPVCESKSGTWRNV